MAEDLLTLTIRVHDPKEKQDAALSASWVAVAIPRAAITLPAAEFAAKYVVPALKKLTTLKLT